MQALDAPGIDPQVAGSRVVYRRRGFDEWYENGRQGLEQGFTVHARPPGKGWLRLEGRLDGAIRAKQREEGAVDFLDANGECVLRYAELRAWDAERHALPARLSVEGKELAILVDDREARYPITVDPLMTSPAWTAESDQADARFGLSVGTAGDINGDGFSDVIVGAEFYDNGQTDEGRAFVYQGSATGLGSSAAWTAESDQAAARFGISVATAGDVNGDGFSDVIVGAFAYTNGQTNEGRAFVYHGSATGLGSSAAWTAESDQASAFFGYSVGTAGDVNGDGFSDVIVGAYIYDNGELNEGRVFAYHGSATGLGSSAAWTAESDQASAFFGYSVATAGDVNGDGFSDVIIGAINYTNGQTQEGRAFVYHGTATGLGSSAAWTAESDQASAFFGGSVGTAGDVNGDGFSDVIVGAIHYSNGQTNEGQAFVYHGSATGLGSSAAWTAESDQVAANFGGSVGTAGDVNGDGFSDVIVGAEFFDNGQTDEGRVFVYHGSATGLGSSLAWTAESDQAAAEFGGSVGTAGDVNGDGFSDVIVGAIHYTNGQTNEGGAFVYHGSAAALATSPAWTAESNQASAFFGGSVATAGDVNGDGFSDVIVGAVFYDNGQTDEGRAFVYLGSATGLATTSAWTAESDNAGGNFGYSVATAGDVNGDGFSDVIVGAAYFSNGQTNEGRAFVYHGSAAGLATSPAWAIESDQDHAFFGNSVSTAGDVNGDGFSDVIVGAGGFDNPLFNEGRAFVYHGSVAGLATSPAWTAESDQAWASFGWSVGTAGDVNGDGFSDVIVGANYYTNGQTNEGRAFVYHGSATGLGSSPAWTAESDQAGGNFGYSVATAGDVNGDGFSDVIVGAIDFDNGQTDEGRAFVYHGSVTGLGSSPAWTVPGEQALGNFGGSVGTAGDVNGDGFSDVIIGDSYFSSRGRAFVYHGSAAGLATSPAWTAESDQVFAYFGSSVATAGDVNGDGFSDVIVGAINFDNGQTDEGRAFAYYGNGGDGLDRVPRQVRTTNLAPISLLGLSNSPTSFRLKALGRSPAGRDSVRLQWEVKPLGIHFDGSGLATSPTVDTGAPVLGTGSTVPLSEIADGLSPGSLYHWRLRIVTDSPFFPRSPWLWHPGNATTEADVRTLPGSVGVDEPLRAADRIWLEAAAPNPFATATRIAYTLPERGHVHVGIYDIAGHEVAVLMNGVQEAGSHFQAWDGRGSRGLKLSAGVYFVRLEFVGRVETSKIILAR